MMRDILTMAGKEWLEIADQFFRLRRGGWSILLSVLFLGVFVPLQIGSGWANSPVMYVTWPFLTASMTSTLVADAIAGERERHTLETLLATRLPDAAILLGKVLASVTYGLAFALTNIAIGLITVRVAFGSAAEMMSVPRFAALSVLLTGTGAMVCGLGVLVSLRASSVRQAQQLFGVFLLVGAMTPLILSRLLSPAAQTELFAGLQRLGVEGVAWRAGVVTFSVALVLITAAVARFRRGEVDLS